MAATGPTTGTEHLRTARRAATVVLALLTAAVLAAAGPRAASAAPPADPAPSPGQIMERVFRAAYGPDGTEVDVILASPQYLRLTKQVDVAARYRPERNFLFLMLEHFHNGQFGEPLRPLLRVDGGKARPPAQVEIRLNSDYHRLSALVYPRPSSAKALRRPRGATGGKSWQRLEIVLPQAGWVPSVLVWTRADEGGGR